MFSYEEIQKYLLHHHSYVIMGEILPTRCQ